MQRALWGDHGQGVVAAALRRDGQLRRLADEPPRTPRAGARREAGFILKPEVGPQLLGQPLDAGEFDLEKKGDVVLIAPQLPITGFLVTQPESFEVQADGEPTDGDAKLPVQQLGQDLAGPQHRVVAMLNRGGRQHRRLEPVVHRLGDHRFGARRRAAGQRFIAASVIAHEPLIDTAATKPKDLSDHFGTVALFPDGMHRPSAQVLHHVIWNLASIDQPGVFHSVPPESSGIQYNGTKNR